MSEPNSDDTNANGPIVVGVDESSTAKHAASVAADLAVATQRRLHVVTAYDHDATNVVSVGSDEFVLSTYDRAEALAKSVASTLGRPGLDVRAAAVRGKPHDILVEVAGDVNASMIVVGNRRMQGPARILGSVANSVAHSAPCDVYIVKTT